MKDIAVISTEGAPAALGPYSQALRANGTIYCSGQFPLDPKTGQIVEGASRRSPGARRSRSTRSRSDRRRH